MKLLVVTQKVDKDDENLGAFHRWFEEFAKHCESVTIIASTVGRYDLPGNVSVYSLGKEKKAGKLKRFWRYLELFSHHYVNSDAVFFHMIPEFVLAAVPFLISLKRPSALWYAHKGVDLKLKMAEHLVDYIFTSSAAGFRLPSKKVWRVGQAIDAETFKPNRSSFSGNGTLSIVTVGRISPVKGYETIIKACGILQKSSDLPWTFSIVGGPLMPRDRKYFTSLKKMVRELGLENKVHFYGPVRHSEIPAILQEHDLFINLSQTGSLDKAILEAMSTGLTVLTANEAYKPILPPDYFLVSTTPEFIAGRLQALAYENRPNLRLRDEVIRNHGLEETVGKIISAISSHV